MSFDCDIKLCDSLCCRNCPVLTEEEALTLIKKVNKEYGFLLEQKKYFRKAEGEHGLYFAVKMMKGQCIFLNRENRCRIYRCRPKLCELYPAVDVGSVDESCPLVLNNKLSREMLDALKKRYSDEIDERIKMEQTFNFI